MISQRLNPRASSSNALQFLGIHALCCETALRALYCKYRATIDTSSVSTATLISLGGKEYAFGMVIDLTTANGRDKLKAAVEDALAEAGYTQDGVAYTVDGNNLTIDTGFSQIAFDYLGVSANTFDKYECQIIGDSGGASGDGLCGGTVTFNEQAPRKFNFAIPASVGDAGEAIQLRDADDNAIASWVSDGLGVGTFQVGGAAYNAMNNENIVFTVDTGTDTLMISDSDVVLKDIYNLTDAVAIAAFTAAEPNYVVIDPVSFGRITNLLVNDGSADVFNAPLSYDSSCTFFSANACSKNGKVYLDTAGLGYTGAVTFTVTVDHSVCDTITETGTLSL
jgi:hypothetical protein